MALNEIHAILKRTHEDAHDMDDWRLRIEGSTG